MGDAKRNGYPGGHFTNSVWEYKHKIHHGNRSVDTSAPTLNGVEHGDLVSAAKTSRAAFDTEIDDIGGSYEDWYDGLDSSDQDFLFDMLSNAR